VKEYRGSLEIFKILVTDSVTVEDFTEAIRAEMLNSNGIITTMGVERILKDTFGLNPNDNNQMQERLYETV
jgi:hypothetical protein